MTAPKVPSDVRDEKAYQRGWNLVGQRVGKPVERVAPKPPAQAAGLAPEVLKSFLCYDDHVNRKGTLKKALVYSLKEVAQEAAKTLRKFYGSARVIERDIKADGVRVRVYVVVSREKR